jgi:DNA-binding transcriptional ArsR family regulator
VAVVKKEKYDRDDIRLARFAKALSHPARIVILRHLAEMNACFFNEISKEIPLAGSTVSQHMHELKNAGLVQSSYEPPKIKYCIDIDNWKLARKQFKEFMKIMASRSGK